MLSDGRRVGLSGIAAPRAFDVPGADAANEWPIEAETLEAVAALVRGKDVEVAIVGSKRDRYGRLDAHVFLPREQGRSIWLQRDLVDAGLARVAPVAERSACARALLAVEASARQGHRGLWRLAAYAVLDAARVQDLTRLRNTYQLVEGEVVSASAVKGRVYLNFGTDWRKDFTAVIGRAQMRFFQGGTIDPMKLAGRRVRVRGWIDLKGGPAIEIEHTYQLQVIDPALPAASPGAKNSAAPPQTKRPDHGDPGGVRS